MNVKDEIHVKHQLINLVPNVTSLVSIIFSRVILYLAYTLVLRFVLNLQESRWILHRSLSVVTALQQNRYFCAQVKAHAE